MKFLLFSLGLALAACGGGSPTGATCPPTDPPTFDSFGDTFMGTYCRECHSANSTNRRGAPGSQNYDTEADILRHAAEIEAEAAAGPDATNTSMPELGGAVNMRPSQAERELLGQYLACLQGN